MLVKLVCYTVNRILTGNSTLGISPEIMPILVDLLPTAYKNTNLGIIPLAIVQLQQTGVLHFTGADAVGAEVVVVLVLAVGLSDLLDAGQLLAILIVGIVMPAIRDDNAVNIILAILLAVKQIIADSALQNTVNEFIIVAGGGSGGAPFHHGRAHLAVGAASVAGLGAGRRLVIDGLSSVDMSAVPGIVISLTLSGGDHILRHLVHLGIHLRAFAGEGIGGAVNEGDDTAIDLHADVDGPELLHALELCVGIGSAAFLRAARIGIAHLQLPGTDGQRRQYTLAGGAVRTRAGNGNGGNVLVVLNRIRCLKAGRHDHMIQLPMAHIVQVDVNRNGLHFFHIRRHDVRIPDRTQQDLVQSGVFGHDLHGRLAGVRLHVDGADHRGIVALLITDRELDMVQAIGQNNTRDGHDTVLDDAGSFHTIDIDLRSRIIKASVIVLRRVVGSLRAEADNILRNSLTIQHNGIRHATCCIGHITEHGCFAVVNRIGIVNGDIVNIHYISAVVRLVLIIPVIIIRTIAVGNIELKNVVISKQIQAFIGAQIDGEVMPARFLILVHKAGCRSDTISQSVYNCTTCCDVFAIVIENERKYSVANPCGNILIGNIYPHAKFGSIFKLLIFAQVCQRCHHITGFEGVTVVDIERHGTVAAVDLAGCRCYGIYLAFRQYIVVCTISEVKVAHVSVFKVEDDFRTLAQLDGSSRRNVRADHCRGDRTRGHTAITGSKVKTVNGADGVIFQRKLDVRRLELHFIQAIRCRHGQRDSLAKGNGHLITVEYQLVGHNSVNRCGTDFAAIVDSRQNDVTSYASGQSTILIRTIRHGILDISRDIGRITGAADARNCNIQRRTGRHILRLQIKHNVVKRVTGHRGRDNEKTVGDTALGTVRGLVDDLESILALRFAAVGHGAAAIQMAGIHAAQIQHDLRLLHQRQTCRYRLLVAIRRHQDHLTVSRDTNGLTGIFLGVVLVTFRKNDLTIEHQHLIDAQAFLNVTLVSIIVIGIADLDRAVLQDCKVSGLFTSGHVIAVHDKYAGWLAGGHVIVGGIDARHDSAPIVLVACRRLFVKGRYLLGELGHTIAGVIHVLIGGKHLHGIHRGIHRGNKHLHLLAILVVDSVRILRHTVSQSRLLVGDKAQLRLCKFNFTLCRSLRGRHDFLLLLFVLKILFLSFFRRRLHRFLLLLLRIPFFGHRSSNFLVLQSFIVRPCGKGGNRQKADQHHCTEQ